jgi:hypothetical protein
MDGDPVLALALTLIFIGGLGAIPLVLYYIRKRKGNFEEWLERLARKHPELFKETDNKETDNKGSPVPTEQSKPGEAKRITLPTLVPKKVKVVVLYPDRQIEAFGRISHDGNMISVKGLGTFTIPENYRPKITWSGRKTYLTFYYSSNGEALTIAETGLAEPKSPDPSFTQLLVDKGLVAKIFRLGLDWTSMMTGLFLGAFVFAVLVFFILPMIGVPVIVGKEAVKVTIQQSQQALPAPGNFTIKP